MMITLEEQRALANINPELDKVLKEGPIPSAGLSSSAPSDSPRQRVRKRHKTLRATSHKKPWIRVESEIPIPDWECHLHPNGSGYGNSMGFCGETAAAVAACAKTPMVFLPIVVHKPRTIPHGGCPGMVVFGGGSSALADDGEAASELCHRFTALGGIAIAVQYRLGPEHKFPVAVRDCFEGLKWVAGNYRDLGIDPDKGFVVGGESCGADFALVSAHLYAQQSRSPKLSGIYASMPWGVSRETVPEEYADRFTSMDQCANLRGSAGLESFEYDTERYDPDPTSPLAYPVAFADHSLLPRTYFQVCGLDCARDCGLIMEQVFKDAGVETRMDVYPGLPHSFWTTFPTEPFSEQGLRDGSKGLRWLLTNKTL